jgi:signal transduction histidine kinase
VVNTIAADRAAGSAGIGLKNVRERIAVQFEGRASLITSQEGTEWRSELTLPAVQALPPLSRELPAAEKYRPSKLVST